MPSSLIRLVSGGVAGLLTLLALAGTTASVLVTSACGNTESRCDTSLSACTTSATYKRNLDITSEQIADLAIVFCVDTTCWTLTPTQNSDGSYSCSSSPDGATCGLAQDEDSGYDLTIQTTAANLDTSSGSATLSANITDTSSNTQLVMLSKVELWTPQYDNGTDCPASCDIATLE